MNQFNSKSTTNEVLEGINLDGNGGIYLEDCNIVDFLGDPDNMDDLRGYAPHSFDEVSEKRLWNVANEMLSTSF